MKFLIWLLILFGLAIGIAVTAHTESGNVFIVLQEHIIRINLHLFILGMIAAVCLLYLLLRIVLGILGTPGRLGRFGDNYRSRKAVQTLNRAGLAFFEGKYHEAETAAAKVLSNKQAGDNRTLAMMIAAHAADASGQRSNRDRYLADMANLPEKLQLSRHLLLADSALSAQDYAAVTQHLQAAAQIHPKLTRLIRLQLRLALEQKQPTEILEKVEKLRRAEAISNQEAAHCEETAYRLMLEKSDNPSALKSCLKRIPESVRQQTLSVAIAERYNRLGLYRQAVAWINRCYPETHNPELLPPFTESVRYLDNHNQQKAIDTADSWLQRQPEDAQLLSCLGILCANRQLWGKAKGYLEASLNISPTVQTRLVLAQVLEESGNSTDAEQHRKTALAEMEEDI